VVGRRLALLPLVIVLTASGMLEVQEQLPTEPATAATVTPQVQLHIPARYAAPPEVPGLPEVTEPLPTSPESRRAFEVRFPTQAAARRGTGPGEDHWALLVGINEHLGPVADNHVSREDAELLRRLLLEAGWHDERILLLTDTDATGAMLREGLSWLARSAGQHATVLLHYSGHSKKWYGQGGAIVDIGLWPTDDDFLRRDELAAALEVIPHARLWGNFATCNAAALHEAGLGDERRVLTYSSRSEQKSYEDPNAGHSVWGSFLLDRAIGDAHGPGVALPVQAAFAQAAPQAHERTAGQRYGPQTPVIEDGLGEPFLLGVTDLDG
jgi:hypothetical protein